MENTDGEKELPATNSEDGIQLHKSLGRLDNLQSDLADGRSHFTVCDSGSTRSVPSSSPTSVLDVRKTASDASCVTGVAENQGTAAVQSFVAAVYKKYNDDEDLENNLVESAADSIVYVPRSGPVRVTASGNIMLPRQVSMSGCEINVAGDPVLIQKMCQKVLELDLMENNIKSWEEVFYIIESIPQLTFLNLTKNQLTSSLPDLQNRRLPNLTHLVLNNTMISWDVVLHLLEVFPNIEELHLSLNGFQSVDLPSASTSSTPSAGSTLFSSYASLHRLFFVGNSILDWRELNKLGAFFPLLEFLLISETDLRTIEGQDDIAHCFPCLHTLGLNRTHLESWDQIQKLRLFPSLKDVRLNGIPFLEEFAEKFRRQHTIALLPNITTLNGSPVKETEREDAERAYIRLYMDKAEIEKTTRYHELERQHGKLDPLVKVSLKPQLQVRLKVRVEGPNKELIKAEEIDIDVNQTIRDLKKLLSNLAGCSVAKFQLFYQDRDSCEPERLNYSDRKVHSYKMMDGDELIIACKE